MSESRLQAGAAQIDITPPAGTHLSGDIVRHRPARLALDPLFAKAIVFEREGRKLCLLALDVTIVTAPYTARIREAASRATGIEPDAIMVHATQTHSAPSVGGFMLDPDFPPLPAEFEWANGAVREYSDFAAERAVEAIRLANDSLRPAQVGAASCIEGRLAFNRRAVTREGGILMPGPSWHGGSLGPTSIRYIEGPMDPELGVLCVRDEALSIRALIANYTCHPVHVFPKPFVSADWPGALAARLQEVHGPQCVSLVVNGACGNINPWPPFDLDYVEDHVRMGTILADRAQAAIEAIQFTDDAVLDWRIAQVPIPLREIPAEELEHAQQVISERPQPTWADESKSGVDYDWMVAASIYSVHLMRQRSRIFDYEVQVLRIGDTAVVGLPGEPFVECGLRIKLASPTYPTYIAHCTTTYVGYIPIREAFDRGGHEVNTRYWAKLVPEAIDLIVEGATGVLQDVFGPS
ncbi:MAG: hypothetical protein FJX75_04365 [Armatimonadetes bacterium]|nr:hypothetical protein [Armatimonadota bacterium]